MACPLPRALLRRLLLCGAAAGGVTGCVPATIFPLIAGAGADVAIFHRSLPDMAYSGMTGRDCSMVRLDRAKAIAAAWIRRYRSSPTARRAWGASIAGRILN